MKPSKLSKALRSEADALHESIVRNEIDPAKLADVSELIRVLARVVEGKTIDEAFGAPGDWGYGTPIGDGIYAMLQEPAQDDSGIQWHYDEDDIPDDEVRVMLALDTSATDEIVFGYRLGGSWWLDNGTEAKVYAWAHAPAKPAKKGGAE